MIRSGARLRRGSIFVTSVERSQECLQEHPAGDRHDVLVRGALLRVRLGPVAAEEKKTSIHLKRRAASAGIHPLKSRLDLNIVSAALHRRPSGGEARPDLAVPLSQHRAAELSA